MRAIPVEILARAPDLFWDVDPSALDPERPEDFILGRVLVDGDWPAVRALRRAIGDEAIASRGARKDFYDLYFICQRGLSLGQALAAFEERFASAQPDLYHRLRALTFFDDAEREPEPKLVRVVEWSAVRAFFVGEVKAIWGAA